eukprot:Protomagalhaensia_sp_Gyna_25__4475@NODE_4100_length_353_cov_2_264331_g3533_i0_p1_GENE_NODE_4100_length_353_cov_2_264331_g3533_i0NODE_4100_length_353_cov_2_264331_g3533_i0_p1_ORF_typecomplete_len103_score1_18_NODE_4100_length_353_cov_2_264331_g3533_i015323
MDKFRRALWTLSTTRHAHMLDSESFHDLPSIHEFIFLDAAALSGLPSGSFYGILKWAVRSPFNDSWRVRVLAGVVWGRALSRDSGMRDLGRDRERFLLVHVD